METSTATPPTPSPTGCGTGGFLLAVVDYLNKHHAGNMSPKQRHAMSEGRMVHGVELVDATARPGTMNMYLHGIGQATG